jgi:hypothetical protein
MLIPTEFTDAAAVAPDGLIASRATTPDFAHA